MTILALTGPVDDGDGKGGERHDRQADAEPDGDADPSHCGAAGEAQNSGRPKASQKRKSPRRRRECFIPSREELLATISKLPHFVATGALSPAQSNSMLASMREVLNSQGSDAQRPSSQAVDKTRLREAVKVDPELLQALAL